MVVWNLSDIYDFKDSEKLVEQLRKLVDEFKLHRNALNSISPDKFMDLIKKQEEISIINSKLNAYAQLWLSENTSDSQRTAYASRISQITTELSNELVFFNLWFKKLDDKKADEFIKASGKYYYMLERMRAFSKFSLEEKEEQIINLKDITGDEALTKLYDMITNKFRFKFKDKTMSQEEINQFKQSPNRKERVDSYDLVLRRYGEEGDVLGEVYKNVVLDWYNENVKVRGFSTPISVRNLGNDIPDKAINALLNVVKKNVKLFQEYFKLKKQMFSLEDRYDLYAPATKDVKEYSYEESKKFVLETYKQFDNKAYELAKKIFDDNHVHSDLTDNKRSGAFCYSVVKDLSPYILLNHVNKLNDLFTMMHEFGHGIHHNAASQQTQFTFHSSLPLAETASIFGEMLLAQRLLKEASKDEKKSIIVKLLDGQYASIVRQAFFVLFEIQAHSKIPEGVTVHELDDLYIANLREQFGDVLPVSDVFKNEWKYIPHIYHTPFYCYAYAFGNLLVLSLYKMYEEQGKDFVPKYLKILEYGGSESPAKILKEIGIDIESEAFWQQGFDVIKEELEELRSLS